MDKDQIGRPPLPIQPPAPQPDPGVLKAMDQAVLELPPPEPVQPPAPQPGTSTLGATDNEGLELPPPVSTARSVPLH
jgi:hypothetical protein